MDESSSIELLKHARSHVLIVNPDAPLPAAGEAVIEQTAAR
jgi:hypothetical protein